MYPRIRREATVKPMPKRVYVDLGYAAAALLAANATGVPFGASLALHAVGIMTTLVAR
jgi:CubicO group peptidase (beta-lactamase class C family)